MSVYREILEALKYDLSLIIADTINYDDIFTLSFHFCNDYDNSCELYIDIVRRSDHLIDGSIRVKISCDIVTIYCLGAVDSYLLDDCDLLKIAGNAICKKLKRIYENNVFMRIWSMRPTLVGRILDDAFILVGD